MGGGGGGGGEGRVDGQGWIWSCMQELGELGELGLCGGRPCR